MVLITFSLASCYLHFSTLRNKSINQLTIILIKGLIRPRSHQIIRSWGGEKTETEIGGKRILVGTMLAFQLDELIGGEGRMMREGASPKSAKWVGARDNHP